MQLGWGLDLCMFALNCTSESHINASKKSVSRRVFFYHIRWSNKDPRISQILLSQNTPFKATGLNDISLSQHASSSVTAGSEGSHILAQWPECFRSHYTKQAACITFLISEPAGMIWIGSLVLVGLLFLILSSPSLDGLKIEPRCLSNGDHDKIPIECCLDKYFHNGFEVSSVLTFSCPVHMQLFQRLGIVDQPLSTSDIVVYMWCSTLEAVGLNF